MTMIIPQREGERKVTGKVTTILWQMRHDTSSQVAEGSSAPENGSFLLGPPRTFYTEETDHEHTIPLRYRMLEPAVTGGSGRLLA